MAAPVLVAAADLRAAAPAQAAIPTVQAVDLFDLSDLLTDAALTTASLITVTVNPDGTVSFALPRAEVGQGITTAIAMVIADEMDLPLDKVDMTLADARPELVFNQITGGSNSVHSLYDQVRVAAAIAKGRLTAGGRQGLGHAAVAAPVEGRRCSWDRTEGRASYGSLTGAAAAAKTAAVVGAAEAAVPAHRGRDPAAADRRARGRDGPQAVRDGSRRSRRAADDALPAAHDQRHRAVGQERGRR